MAKDQSSRNGKEGDHADSVFTLLKRRGFVFLSSEIYGGLAGVYDFGPLGALLSQRIKQAWWRAMVDAYMEIYALDTAIFMHPRVWEASGHTTSFSDPLVSCRACKKRFRADHLLEEIGVLADEKMTEEEIGELFVSHQQKIACPSCGTHDWVPPKMFNLLVTSNLGDFSGEGNRVYLRGETAQGIYVNFKNVCDTMHARIPFGVAQIGKAFRNEITPRQFLFRTREFEQMEMQYFVRPEDEMHYFEKWRSRRFAHLTTLGIREENMRWRKHENLVFYAKEAYDIEYRYPFGWKELEGIHARGNYDLSVHAKNSGKDLSYFDPQTHQRYIPHVVETSIGVGRLFMALVFDAYREETVGGEKRVVLAFKRHLAPISIAVLPLSKKEPLVTEARKLYSVLSRRYTCHYDDTQSIGRRYRRQDEIGTPYCVTYDFDSVHDHSVTVRDRDSMQQERIHISDLEGYFSEKFSF